MRVSIGPAWSGSIQGSLAISVQWPSHVVTVRSLACLLVAVFASAGNAEESVGSPVTATAAALDDLKDETFAVSCRAGARSTPWMGQPRSLRDH